MKITYDNSADAAYLYLGDEIEASGVARTYSCDPVEVRGQINLDFDADGRLVGIELLDASKRLPKTVLTSLAGEPAERGSQLFLADWLKNNRGYGLAPLPNVRDEKIGQVMKAWIALSEDERAEAQSHISRGQSDALLIFGERMASLAVRERDPGWLTLGLLALGIEGGYSDWRENWLIVPLHYDAAKRIYADPKPIFENVATWLGGPFAEHLRGFLNKPQPIDVMGYRVGADDGGFCYQRTW